MAARRRRTPKSKWNRKVNRRKTKKSPPRKRGLKRLTKAQQAQFYAAVTGAELNDESE